MRRLVRGWSEGLGLAVLEGLPVLTPRLPIPLWLAILASVHTPHECLSIPKSNLVGHLPPAFYN